MHKEKNQQNSYDACIEEGSFIPLAEVDKDKIKSMLHIALIDLESANFWEKGAEKESGKWNALYKIYYDVLHELAETFILLDGIKARTHECVFAYLCEKHKELELDWNFLEKIRIERNRSIYYGEIIDYTKWKFIESQMKLYIRTLKKEIEEKLNE